MAEYPVDPNDILPLYYQIYHSLLERIQAGEFEVGDALPSERRLAEEYGVSRITVIKALDELQQEGRIERQHGRGTFVTEPKGNGDDDTLSIAFLPGVFHHPYLFSVLMGIARTATEQHVHLQVMGAYENSQQETRYVNEAIERGIDGLIIYPRAGYENLALYRRLQREGFPFVMIDRYYPQVSTDRVVFGDEEAAYELTRRLLARGHRRIAVLTHHEVETTSVRDRLWGYRRALAAADLPYGSDLVWLDVYAQYDPVHAQQLPENSGMTERLRRRLKQEAPTALLAINQDVAERVVYDLMLIQNEKMRAVLEGDGDHGDPDYELALELAAFSHSRRALDRLNPVALATHSGERLGQRAAELLLERLRGAVSGPPRPVTVPMTISPPAVAPVTPEATHPAARAEHEAAGP